MRKIELPPVAHGLGRVLGNPAFLGRVPRIIAIGLVVLMFYQHPSDIGALLFGTPIK
ncbi:diguanylate cyclase (GGDEF) domain-containing protein [Burkholderiales bacterium GJ-E10]|nr:diguanylate cyclase (GGDEF) domain-containing protein [Burkholderiales bacterium GJ-E10]